MPRLDITGQRYGKLVAIKFVELDSANKARWLCICDCGKEVVVRANSLRSGAVISCGCAHKDAGQRRVRDLSGQRFGRLTVDSRAPDDPNASNGHTIRWNCVCDCGNKVILSSNSLTTGNTRSCGCYRKDVDRQRYERSLEWKKHPLYSVWCGMKERCYNPNHCGTPYYLSRGISVCEEWRDNFEAFRDWGIQAGWRKGMTLDRIDNNKGYSPDNCRWATYKQQMNNTNRNLRIEYQGEIHTLPEWCDILNLDYEYTYARFKRGWPAELAFTKPKGTWLNKEEKALRIKRR